jgi:hypothetical protein
VGRNRSYLNAVMVHEWAAQSGVTLDALDVFSSGPHSGVRGCSSRPNSALVRVGIPGHSAHLRPAALVADERRNEGGPAQAIAWL